MRKEILAIFLTCPWISLAQGTFQNLGFESADLTGFSPGAVLVPAANALPAWSLSYSNVNDGSTFSSTTVWYDNASLGGYAVSIDDLNNPLANGPGAGPLEEKYRVALYGGQGFIATSIHQAGLIPIGTQSLQAKYSWFESGPVFTLNGQTINMTPIARFPTYTLYGGDVSTFAGQSATLSITAPPGGPSMVFLDDIQFSTQPVPEPGVLRLAALGAALSGLIGFASHVRKPGFHSGFGSMCQLTRRPL